MDPTFAAWLEASNPPLPPGFQPTLEQMRDGFVQQAVLSNEPVDTPLDIIDDHIISRDGNAIATRIYKHRDTDVSKACCLYVHGGGWVLGSLDTHQGICIDLALRTGLQVVALDYRLSPEHHYPAALHDTLDVLQDLQARPSHYSIDPTQVSIAADSAGTSLSVAACLSLAGSKAMPGKLALVYPALGADMDRPSFKEFRELPGLTPEIMHFFFTSYLGGETLPDPLAAPLNVENIGSLPPVFISAAELDPLRDDATDMAARLKTANVSVELRIEPGLGHGYLWVRRQSTVAANAFTALAAFLEQDKR